MGQAMEECERVRTFPVASVRVAIALLVAAAVPVLGACAANSNASDGAASKDSGVEDTQGSLVSLPARDGTPIRLSATLSIHDAYDEEAGEHRLEIARDGRNILAYPYQRHVSVGISGNEKYLFINDNFASNQSDCKILRLSDPKPVGLSEPLLQRYEYLSEYYRDHLYVDCIGIDSKGLASIRVHGYAGTKQIDRQYSFAAEEL
jgi:hypothetical protein